MLLCSGCLNADVSGDRAQEERAYLVYTRLQVRSPAPENRTDQNKILKASQTEPKQRMQKDPDHPGPEHPGPKSDYLSH